MKPLSEAVSNSRGIYAELSLKRQMKILREKGIINNLKQL